MKMKQDDFAALGAALSSIKLPDNRTFAGVLADYIADGLTERRFLFDCLYSIPAANRRAWFERGIYEYLNDDHIHTALKRWMQHEQS